MAGSPAAQLHHALGDEDHTLTRGQIEDARAGAGPRPGTRPATGISAEVVGAPSTWGKLAACAGEWSVFFGARGERPDTRDRREARAGAICATCSMLTPCREWAREHREYGYWGGESEEDRARAGFVPVHPGTTVAGIARRLRREQAG